MRNTWARAWLAASALLVAASALARSRHDTLLRVEEPVMEWLLDGTDTSGWDRVSFVSAPWLLIIGTIVLTIVAAVFDRKVAVAVVFTSLVATGLAMIVRNIVERPSPTGALDPGSFPNLELVQTGVFLGLVVLTFWWLGAPRLLWQIAIEVAVVIELAVAIRLTVAGEIWPSDAVGSAIVIVVSLIMAAVVFESFAPRLPWAERKESSDVPVAA